MFRMPPARLHSWMENFCVLGASLHRQGTLRLSASMSAILKSTPASLATANKWSTVFDDPPMAMSSVMALRKACRVAMLRGNTLSSPSS